MECEITKPRKKKEEVVQKLVQVTENKEQKTEQEKVRQKKASDAKEKKENKKEMEVEKPFRNLQMKESNRNHAVSSKGTLFIKFVFISFLCSLFLEQNDNLDASESYNHLISKSEKIWWRKFVDFYFKRNGHKDEENDSLGDESDVKIEEVGGDPGPPTYHFIHKSYFRRK